MSSTNIFAAAAFTLVFTLWICISLNGDGYRWLRSPQPLPASTTAAYLVTPTPGSPQAINVVATGWKSAKLDPKSGSNIPVISLNYPPEFDQEPSITSHDIVLGDEENRHALVLDFSTDLAGLFDISEGYPSFEKYVHALAYRSNFDGPVFLRAGAVRVARLRSRSKEDYDADQGVYLVELADKSILTITTSGTAKFLFDEGKDGLATTDRIMLSLTIHPAP